MFLKTSQPDNPFYILILHALRDHIVLLQYTNSMVPLLEDFVVTLG